MKNLHTSILSKAVSLKLYIFIERPNLYHLTEKITTIKKLGQKIMQ